MCFVLDCLCDKLSLFYQHIDKTLDTLRLRALNMAITHKLNSPAHQTQFQLNTPAHGFTFNLTHLHTCTRFHFQLNSPAHQTRFHFRVFLPVPIPTAGPEVSST